MIRDKIESERNSSSKNIYYNKRDKNRREKVSGGASLPHTLTHSLNNIHYL